MSEREEYPSGPDAVSLKRKYNLNNAVLYRNAKPGDTQPVGFTGEAWLDYVPPAKLVAIFHKDGTLWLEKPLQIRFQHGWRAIGKMAAEKSEVRRCQPFEVVYERDMAWLGKIAADFASWSCPHFAEKRLSGL